MSKQEDYRRYAAQAVKLAQGASTADAKAHLLAVAEAWVDLGDLAARIKQAAGARPGRLDQRPDQGAADEGHTALEILPQGTWPDDVRVVALIGRARPW